VFFLFLYWLHKQDSVGGGERSSEDHATMMN